MNRTTIEWVRNPDGTPGYTFNPITGCLNHINGKCKGGGFPCYAYKIANGRVKQRYLNNQLIALPENLCNKNEYYYDPFYPRFWSERLKDVPDCVQVPWSKEKGIFVCDMSDLFGIGIPDEWTKKVLHHIKANPQHRFYLLTKQPQNLPKFSPFPDNCWVGVTATNREMAYNAYCYLSDIKARVRYLSLEPLLSWYEADHVLDCALDIVNWIIIGSQTKPYKPPKIEWVKEIVEAADAAGVKVFLKDNLRPILKDRWPNQPWAFRDGYYTSDEHPDIDRQLRQEMPEQG